MSRAVPPAPAGVRPWMCGDVHESGAVCRNERNHPGAHWGGTDIEWTHADSASRPKTPREAHRMALVGLPMSRLVQVLSGRLRVSNLPEGAEVVNVHYDFLRHEMAIMLAHGSFDIVHPGCEAPYAPVELETVTAAETLPGVAP
jgi:hypothetical protein